MNRKIRHNILFTTSLLMLIHGFIAKKSIAQDAIQFSQYFSNQLAINPAYAGANDALSITMVHRNQWTGINGAPSTTTLTGHTLFKSKNTGVGINLFMDKINIHSQVSFSGVYSYRIKLNSTSYLSMGLQAGLNYAKSDYASLSGTIFSANDPGIPYDEQTELAFQFGAGAYYLSEKLEIGFSSPILHSSGSSMYVSDSLKRLSTIPHYFLFSRYQIRISPHIKLKPGFLLKFRSGRPLAVDVNLEAALIEVLNIGLSYRSFESISTFFQVKILPQMKFGYAYDIPISDVKRRYFNSHELMLNYIFAYKNYNVNNPR